MQTALCALALFLSVDPIVLRPGDEARGTLTEAAPRVPVEVHADAAGPVTVEVHAPTCFTILRRLDESLTRVASDHESLHGAHPQMVVEAGPDGPVRLKVSLRSVPGGDFVVRCYAGAPRVVTFDAALQDARACHDATVEAHGRRSLPTSRRASIVATALSDKREYKSAARWFEKSVQIAERHVDPCDDAILRTVYAQAEMLSAASQKEKALMEEALSVMARALERCSAPDGVLARELRLYSAILRLKIGDLDRAEAELRACVEAWTGRSDVAETLGRAHLSLAVTLLRTGREDEGARELRHGFATLTDAFGARHPAVARAYVSTGEQLGYAERWGEAEEYLRRGLALRRELLGERHDETIDSLGSLSWSLYYGGHYEQALACDRRALAILRDFPDRGRDQVRMARKISFSLRRLGRHEEAASIRADIRRRELALLYAEGAGPRRKAEAHHAFAKELQGATHLAEAEEQFRIAWALRIEAGGRVNRMALQSMVPLAIVLTEQRRAVEAEPILREAVLLHDEAFGPDHPVSISLLFPLGDCLVALGQLEEAEQCFLELLERFDERRGGPVKRSLARVCRYAGRFVEAETWCREAIEMLREQIEMLREGLDPRLAKAHAELAAALVGQGRLEEAEIEYRRALDVAAVHPPGSPFLVRIQADLALLFVEMGRTDDAVALATGIERATFERAVRELSFTPPELRFPLIRQVRRSASLVAALVDERGGTADLYPTLASAKGLSFRLASLGDGRKEGETPRTRALRDEVDALTSRLSAMTYARGITDEAAHRAEFARLQQERRDAERAILTEQTLQPDAVRVDPAAVAALLPEGTALLDLVEFRPARWTRIHADVEEFEDVDRARFLAWVLRPGEETPAFVDLGSAKRMRRLIEDALAVLAPNLRAGPVTFEEEDEPAPADDPALTALREALFDPLAPHLGGVTRLVVSPDGALSELPFEALPIGGGNHLLHAAEVVYVQDAATVRALLEAAAPERLDEPSLLALGGVDFDARGAVSAPVTSDVRGERAFSTKWGSLPETAVEARAIAAGFEGQARLLSGTDATEEAVKAAAPDVSILHLATHGFYQRAGLRSLWASATIEDDDDVPLGIGAGAAAAARDASKDRPLLGVSPGLLTGVVLAGVNADTPAGRDDGVLTGDEVARLDLSKCELAVLSACETALGQSSPGEGVMSLRRSFREAGARTVISTLWRVDDKATRMLMTEFYRRLLEKRQSPGLALRGAKLHLLKNTEFTHPRYWAAFTLAGNWR